MSSLQQLDDSAIKNIVKRSYQYVAMSNVNTKLAGNAIGQIDRIHYQGRYQ